MLFFYQGHTLKGKTPRPGRPEKLGKYWVARTRWRTIWAVEKGLKKGDRLRLRSDASPLFQLPRYASNVLLGSPGISSTNRGTA